MNFDFFRTGFVQGIQEFFYFDPGTFKKNRFFKFYEFPVKFFVFYFQENSFYQLRTIKNVQWFTRDRF